MLCFSENLGDLREWRGLQEQKIDLRDNERFEDASVVLSFKQAGSANLKKDKV